MEKNVLTRRDFLKTTSSAAIAGALFLGTSRDAFSEEVGKKTRVVLIRDNAVVDEAGKIDPNVVQNMLDTSVTALLGEKDPAAAWKRIVKPEDIVGIKTNNWGHLPTPEALELAIQKRVLEVGVSEKNIGIRDQGLLDDEIFKKATALINVRPLRTSE